jgi:hypothetical protein
VTIERVPKFTLSGRQLPDDVRWLIVHLTTNNPQTYPGRMVIPIQRVCRLLETTHEPLAQCGLPIFTTKDWTSWVFMDQLFDFIILHRDRHPEIAAFLAPSRDCPLPHMVPRSSPSQPDAMRGGK